MKEEQIKLREEVRNELSTIFKYIKPKFCFPPTNMTREQYDQILDMEIEIPSKGYMILCYIMELENKLQELNELNEEIERVPHRNRYLIFYGDIFEPADINNPADIYNNLVTNFNTVLECLDYCEENLQLTNDKFWCHIYDIENNSIINLYEDEYDNRISIPISELDNEWDTFNKPLRINKLRKHYNKI